MGNNNTNSKIGKTRGTNDQEHHPKEMDKEPKSKQQKHNKHNKEREHFQLQIQNNQTASKEEDIKGEQWHHDLTDSLNHHRNLLCGLDTAVKAQRDYVNSLLLRNAENTLTNAQPDDTIKTEGAKPTFLKGAVDILENIQNTCEFIAHPLKDSFGKLHLDIDNSLERFGKKRIAIDIQQQRKGSETVQKEVETSSSEVRILEEEVRQLKQDAATQKSENKELKRQKRQLTSELELYRPQTGLSTIQLFIPHEGNNTIKDIEKGLKAMVASKLKNISFQTFKKASDIDPSKLVIVVYIVTTRVGTDAANAIEDIKNPGNTILVLIHYKNAHSLSNERSTDVLNDQKSRNLLGILDLAFMTDSGFYHCNINESGIDALCALCRQRPGGDRS